MDIEASRQAVSSLSITLNVLTSLRESARLTATHYSTQIEGNRLTQEQVEDVIQGGTFPNRERDEREVKNYYLALDYVDALIKQQEGQITERHLQTIHGLVMDGKKKPTPYRDSQNVIKDRASGRIVYMPPEAPDVPELMKALLDWIAQAKQKASFPVPIIAAIAHYQFATIHPYYDGNGRTARLFTNFVLHMSGYGLKGIYSLEEYYAQDLQSYYDALTVGASHNYYMGRAEADVTKWIDYFCSGMADAFAHVRVKAQQSSNKDVDHSSLLRELDTRQKQVLPLFKESRFVTAKDIAGILSLHQRTVLNNCHQWVKDGFIIQHGTANKSRKYELAQCWLVLIE
jgi:Fic family protein